MLAALAISLSPAAPESRVSAAGEAAAESEHLQYFEQNVRPLLEQHCQKCHGASKQESGLRLDTAVGAMGGGDSGAAIVPGDLEASLLISAIRREDGLEMPPEKPLRAEEVRILEKWVAEGAAWPDYDGGAIIASVTPAALDLSPPEAARHRSRPLAGESPRAADDARLKPSLEVWLRADSLAIADRSMVDQWADSSGHERHAAPTMGVAQGSGAAPTFVAHSAINGRAAVRFREGDGLATPGSNPPETNGDSAYTLIIVACIASRPTPSTSGIVGFGDPVRPDTGGRPAAALVQISRAAGGDVLQLAGGFGLDVNLGAGSAELIYNRPMVLTIVKSPGPASSTTRFYLNGSVHTLFEVSGPLTPGVAPEIVHRSDVGLILGHALGAVGGFCGDVSEVVLYNTALADDDRRAVEAGLVEKYGIFDPVAVPDRSGDPVRDELWALRPLVDWSPPAVKDASWPRNGLDQFVLAELERRGLTPAPAADRRTLVRRVHYDMLGLPPSPELVRRFVNDSSPDAYPKLVEELMKSPYYGERWGRHWLDVVRYADSGGYETDVLYRNAWRYRDYVVKSFNEDKPYDQFVQEQVAGDEIWPDNLDLYGKPHITPEQQKHLEARIGTGMYTFGPMIHESNMEADKIRYEWLTDWVDTTGAAFLGLTLGCARCHDHKFDPISQRDYFAMQSLFAPSKEVETPLITAMEIADHKQHYPRVWAVQERRTAVNLFDARVAGRELTAEEKQQREDLMRQLAQAVLDLPENAGSAPGSRFAELWQVPTATVLGHHEPALQPDTYLLHRGDLGRAKERVEPDLPAVLRNATSYEDELPGPFENRKALALWLTRPDHPLTARVMANRLWQWHFGVGIVPTANDFGKMGVPPSHPELLDWLSLQLVRSGWSVKELHRIILLSNAYQMASAHPNAAASNLDPDNRLLWRMNRQRLESEAVWDFIHAVGGTLNLQMGGRPVSPPLSADEAPGAPWMASVDPAQQVRRALYILTRRNFRYPVFDIFDSAVTAVSSPGREVTVVAPQALWALNNPRVFEQAQAFAARVVREAGEDQAAWIDHAWMLALSRAPTESERNEARKLLEDFAQWEGDVPLDAPPAELAKLPASHAAALTKLCLGLFNSNEFFFIE